MKETRTTLQIEANKLDLEMFRLSEKMEEFAKLTKDTSISLDAG